LSCNCRMVISAITWLMSMTDPFLSVRDLPSTTVGGSLSASLE
jgi:hypothetical protein